MDNKENIKVYLKINKNNICLGQCDLKLCRIGAFGCFFNCDYFIGICIEEQIKQNRKYIYCKYYNKIYKEAFRGEFW